MTAPLSPVSDDQQAPAEELPVAAPVVPDRGDAPVSEVSERFLRAVMTEIPLDRLEELHLFSPLRQGTVETGIAVLAVRVPVIAPETAADAALAAADPELPFVADDEEAADVPVPADDQEVGSMAVVPDVGDDDEDVSAIEPVVAEVSGAEEDEAVAAADSAPESDGPTPLARPVRHTVYTARYRYVIKGPERGKWESNLKAEAEAPLVTVETVVRGVQRRAGEDSEIIRYTAAQIAKILRVPFPASVAAE